MNLIFIGSVDIFLDYFVVPPRKDGDDIMSET